MAYSHDHSLAILLAARGDLELAWQALLFHDEGVIAIGNHRRIDSAKDGAAVMLDHAGFAMHDAIGANDRSSEGGADGLMSQAYAQDRDLAREMTNELE